MNIESMRIKSHRSFAVDEAPLPPAAAERLKKLNKHDDLRADGCGGAAALRHAGLSRRTLCRWKAALAAGGQRGLAPKSTRPRRVRHRAYGPKEVKAVLDMRRKHPFMGKARIHAMLARKGSRLSVSTIGRIIERALARGAIPRASLCEGRLKPRRRRSFNNWARRWRYGARARSPGELVRIDHMTYTRDGRTLKEFRAICPVTKFMVSRVRSRATARNAGRFLDEALAAFPFAVSSIQVDGGSEFMGEFEDACAKLGIQLHVLPPRRPQWNGCVERANRSARIEFRNRYGGPLTVTEAAKALAKYEFLHNYLRPHASLEYQTPNEYLVTLEAA